MALHRAEQIVAAVVTTLTGLTTTSTRVFRARSNDVPDTDTPHLCVYMGPDNPRSDGGSSSYQLLDGDLTVYVEAVAKELTDEAAETKANLIRKEVTIALMANYTLGLSFVMNAEEGQAIPDIDGSGEKPVCRLRMEWRFHYRRSRTDPSA